MEAGSQYHTEVLDRVPLRARATLRQHFGEKAIVNAFVDAVCQSLVMEVTQPVWGQTGESFCVSYPADWWQAFKDRWFPHWLRLRYPVVYTTEGVKVRFLYPKQAFPDYKVQLARWDGDLWDWNRQRR